MSSHGVLVFLWYGRQGLSLADSTAGYVEGIIPPFVCAQPCACIAGVDTGNVVYEHLR